MQNNSDSLPKPFANEIRKIMSLYLKKKNPLQPKEKIQ